LIFLNGCVSISLDQKKERELGLFFGFFDAIVWWLGHQVFHPKGDQPLAGILNK